jgi:hypothetical protein
MDNRGNFSARVPNRAPPNFQRPIMNPSIQQNRTEQPKPKNNNLYLIAGLSFLVLIILGVILFLSLNGKDNTPAVPTTEEPIDEEVPEITSGGCEKLGLEVNSQKEYTCLDSQNKLLKIYITRALENVILNRVNFTIFYDSKSLEYSSSYGLAPGSFYIYQIGFNETNIERIEITPIVKDDGGEKECSKVIISTLQPCVVEEVYVEPTVNYTFDENMNVVLVNQSLNESLGTSVEEDSFLSFFADKPKKKILNFSIDSVYGEIDELRHIIYINFEDDRDISSLSPNIQISVNSTIDPSPEVVRDFSNPVIYTITASDGSTQNYTVYVSTIDAVQEIPAVVDSSAPLVYLNSIESNNLTTRQVIFNVSDEGNISNCTLYSGSDIVNTSSNIVKLTNNAFTVPNLAVGLYSYSVKCSDNLGNVGSSNIVSFRVNALYVPVPVDGACGTANKSYTMNDSGFGSNTFCTSGSASATPTFPGRNATSTWQCLGSNGGNNASCSAKRVIITNVLGTIAGEWSTDLAAAELMAKLNKNYYIIEYGASTGCSFCISAYSAVFSKPEFKQWAYNNGIALIYADQDKFNTNTTKFVYNKYVAPMNFDYMPIIILIGYESSNAIGSFSFSKTGVNINGVIMARTVVGFLQIVDSYTQQYA